MRHPDVKESGVPADRLMSLDVLRGFDMFFIMGGWQLVISLCVLLGFGDSCWLAEQMKHVDWHGFHFCDLIFPLFVFISGVTYPYSFAKGAAAGATVSGARLRILRRSLVLVALGFAVDGFFADGSLHFGSVLGRIGISWGIAAFAYTALGLRMRVVCCAAALLGYWAFMRFVGAPDHPEAGVFTPLGNVSGWLDRLVFPSAHFAAEGPYYNQGFLGTLTTVPVTAMLGVFAGELLRCGRLSPERKSLALLVAGVALAALGCIVAFGCGPLSFPVNKKLWSPSFVLVAGGCSSALLAVFHYLVDVKSWWRHTLFFVVIGMNPIAIYVAQRFVDFRFTARFFLGGLSSALPQAAGAALLDLGYVAVCWLLLFALYARRVFIKV